MAQTARLARARAYEEDRPAHLRVVPRRGVRRATARPAAKTRLAGRRVADARVRALFTSCVALLVALTGVGLVRVAVVARAAEMTITADRLSREIKAQRIETDELELDRSSLQAPSRIDGIASETMKMGAPASVRYISLPGDEAEQVAEVAPADEAASAWAQAIQTTETAEASAAPAQEALSAALAAIVRMSAGEAQALLLGDIGLAGSR